MLRGFDVNDDDASLKFLEDATTSAKQIQKEVLEEILSLNANTEYLRSYLDGVEADKVNFKKLVPMVSYEDIKSYMDRIANDGEPSDIISSQPITEFACSSGTTGGKRKMFPLTSEELDRRTVFFSLCKPIVSKCIDGLDGRKSMNLFFVKSQTKTPSGLTAGPFLTTFYKSTNFRNLPSNWYNDNTGPYEAIVCPDIKQSMYCQLLCGLVRRHEIVRIGTTFGSVFLRAITFLEDHWKEICSNIRAGELSDWITDNGCRTAVSSVLYRPNLELADSIESVCVSKSWEGIVRKLWPETRYIETILTGSMGQYVPMVEFYAGRGLPLVSPLYGSSECFFGLNVKPLDKPSDVSYTFLPNMAYFEFLPLDTNGDETSGEKKQDQLVDLADVEIGRCYEPVVTTLTGLYRYRIGDALKVTGFHNKTPQFQFLQRQNIVLSIDVDKTTEVDLAKAVSTAISPLQQPGFILVDYTSFGDTSSLPGHYVLFWELKSNDGTGISELDPSVMEKCCFALEGALDSVYKECRGPLSSIGPLEIRVVKKGTFTALMDLLVSQGSSVNQYKTPRSIKSSEALKLLNSAVIAKYFSKQTP